MFLHPTESQEFGNLNRVACVLESQCSHRNRLISHQTTNRNCHGDGDVSPFGSQVQPKAKRTKRVEDQKELAPARLQTGRLRPDPWGGMRGRSKCMNVIEASSCILGFELLRQRIPSIRGVVSLKERTCSHSITFALH